MRRKIGKQKGLTLMEMIIAIAIMTIFIGIVTTVVTQSIKLYSKQAGQVSLEDTLRAVQDRMVRDLRPCNWAQAQRSTSSTYLYFSSNGPTTNQYYKWQGTTLYRKLATSVNIDPIADNITYFDPEVRPITPSTNQVYIELTASSTGTTRVTKTTSFSVNLRTYK